MGNIGAAVSQEGYDVKDSADRLKVFSSSFQTLKIYNTYLSSITLSDGTTGNITVTHNIGFLAPFIVISNGDSITGTTISKIKEGPIANTTTLVISTTNNTGSTATFYYTSYVFLNNFSTITASEINTSVDSGANSTDYGIRISKDGFDVKTCDNKDCVLSSSFFNRIIHMQGTLSGAGTITHNLGYYPSVLVYNSESGTSLQFLSFIYSTTTTTLELISDENSYYIIFK